MQFSFDLISDISQVSETAWDNQPSSLYCVVAGNISPDRAVLKHTLVKIATQYSTVIYIDGWMDHLNYVSDLPQSILDLKRLISGMKNVVHLHDNCVMVENMVFVGVNGWWTYDWNKHLDVKQMTAWLETEWKCKGTNLKDILTQAELDAGYLNLSVDKISSVQDINEIVLVSNTVPRWEIVSQDPDYKDKYRLGIMGNSHLETALLMDHNNKVKTWCFGHYEQPVDMHIDGIRYVSNPLVNKPPYPKKILCSTPYRQARS